MCTVNTQDTILNIVKNYCNVDKDETAYDEELAIIINPIIFTLQQLGVVFTKQEIAIDEDIWDNVIEKTQISSVCAMYVCLRARQLFDTPTSSTMNTALENTVKEYEWRILVECDQ